MSYSILWSAVFSGTIAKKRKEVCCCHVSKHLSFKNLKFYAFNVASNLSGGVEKWYQLLITWYTCVQHWQIHGQLHVWTVCRLHLHVDVEHVESDSPGLSVSFLSLSDIMDSGAVKAVRQGHRRHFSAPQGAVCQSWLWFKASHVINNRVNQLATGGGPGVNVSVNCEHSSLS